jgi:O-antigen/teichoic acid export membrane protein
MTPATPGSGPLETGVGPPRPELAGPRLRGPRRGGAAILASSNLVARACAFLGVILIARVLGTTDFALVLLAQAVTQYLLIVLDFGLTLSGIRTIASDLGLTREVMGAALATRLVAAIVGTLVIVLVGAIVGADPNMLILILAFALAGVVSSVDLSWVAQAHQSTLLRALVSGGGAFLGLVLLAVFLPFSPVPLTVALAQIIGVAIAVGAGLVVTFRTFGLPMRPRVPLLRTLIGASIPLGLASLLAQVYYNVDILLLGLWRPLAEVASYGAAYKLVLALLMLIWTYAGVALPRLTRASAIGPVALAAQVHRDLVTVVGWTLPAAILGALFARPVIELLFGSEYIDGAVPLTILLCTVPIAAFRTILLYSFTASGRPWAVPLSSGPGAVVNVILNVMLIPVLGMVGAAVTTLVAEIVVTAVAAWQARSMLRLIRWRSWPRSDQPGRL